MIPTNKQFLVVNAFATAPYGGNPAAVFTNGSGLESETMQAIARQLNLVETVFVLPGEGEIDFRLRYFTPSKEIPVAGHPSIAAWLALVHRQIVDAKVRTHYLQANLAGTQKIEINCADPARPIVTMKQPPARFLNTDCTREKIASVFEITVDDLNQDLPIRAVDTGLGHLIVPLRSLDALFRVKRNIEPLRQLCQSLNVSEAQLFCFDTDDKSLDMHTRNICPREGIEDPACGVGNGALTAYISEFYWTTKTEFVLKIEQGTIVQMPSLIHTQAIRTKDALDVFVGGAGVVMLEGNFVV